MIDEILINVGPRRRRIALIERGSLAELFVTQDGTALPGRIVLGRVRAVREDLDAAFVDIGEGRDGLLPAPDTAAKRGTSITKAVHESQAVLVQVRREAEDEKGARLSARIRLAGQGLLMRPGGSDVEVSRHINDPARRDQLRALGSDLQKRMSCGLVLRSGAAVMTDAALVAEAEALSARWQAIAKAGEGRAPALLDPGDDPMTVLLREHMASGLKRIRIDDAGFAAQLARDIETDGISLEIYAGPAPLFTEYDLEGQIEVAMSRDVSLPSGGRISIEHTQALTAIDVDSGSHDGRGDPGRLAREINGEAAREIARQLRLREIGGLVVIDFIAMSEKGAVGNLLQDFQGWLNDDPAPVRLGRMSELGLVELTRRRRQPALALRHGAACPLCQGSGRAVDVRWIADNLLDRILRESDASKGGRLAVKASPAVVEDLAGQNGKFLAELAKKRGVRVQLEADAALAVDAFEVTVLT